MITNNNEGSSSVSPIDNDAERLARIRHNVTEHPSLPNHPEDTFEFFLRLLDSRDAALREAREALEPFAEIGQWLFARDLPDDTPLVEIEHLGGIRAALTRGHFKAAHLATGDSQPATPSPDVVARSIYESVVTGRRDFREAYQAQRDENKRLREALTAVRVKAIPAGGAAVRQSEGWEDRCTEVLDIIDDALAVATPSPVPIQQQDTGSSVILDSAEEGRKPGCG